MATVLKSKVQRLGWRQLSQETLSTIYTVKER